MKNTTFNYLIGFLLFISYSKANTTSRPLADSSICLEIEGIILNAHEGVDKTCLVELLFGNRIEQSVLLKDGKKKVKFLLRKNANYTVRISKKEHVTKLICIDTRMKKVNNELYSFSFETQMIPEALIEKADRECLDFPVALIYYDVRKDCFMHDKEYSNKLKKEIAVN
jgi:hypothetical protein